MEKLVNLDYEKIATQCRARACYGNLDNLGAKEREVYIKGVNMVLKHLKQEVQRGTQEQLSKE